MSGRFPLGDASSIGHGLDVEVAKVFPDNSRNFEYKDKSGLPIGPFAVLAQTPDLFPPYANLTHAILHQPSSPPLERELAILAVASVHSIPYVTYAHARIASSLHLLNKEQIESATKGVTPDGLTDVERVVYVTAKELAGGKGVLGGEVWGVAERVLGRGRCARLAHVVGLYLYTGSLLRMGDVPAPEGEGE